MHSSPQHRAGSGTTQKRGRVKHVLESEGSREAWSARYEQLRRGWLACELTWGQALFVRQGMAAWMKVWSLAEPCESVTRSDSTVLESNTLEPIAIGGELQRQLARELANLILHRQQEAVA